MRSTLNVVSAKLEDPTMSNQKKSKAPSSAGTGSSVGTMLESVMQSILGQPSRRNYILKDNQTPPKWLDWPEKEPLTFCGHLGYLAIHGICIDMITNGHCHWQPCLIFRPRTVGQPDEPVWICLWSGKAFGCSSNNNTASQNPIETTVSKHFHSNVCQIQLHQPKRVASQLRVRGQEAFQNQQHHPGRLVNNKLWQVWACSNLDCSGSLFRKW